jgi:hypothetical protein
MYKDTLNKLRNIPGSADMFRYCATVWAIIAIGIILLSGINIFMWIALTFSLIT